MPTDRPLIMIIERFLDDTGLAATTFGRLAMRDPRFVLDLRAGRQPGTMVRCKVEHFMNKWRADYSPVTDHRAPPQRAAA